MTDDLTALVAGVVAAPWDAAPRLVLADYLDERGHAEWAADLRHQTLGPMCADAFVSVLTPGGGFLMKKRSRIGIREAKSIIDTARAVHVALGLGGKVRGETG